MSLRQLLYCIVWAYSLAAWLEINIFTYYITVWNPPGLLLYNNVQRINAIRKASYVASLFFRQVNCVINQFTLRDKMAINVPIFLDKMSKTC